MGFKLSARSIRKLEGVEKALRKELDPSKAVLGFVGSP